MIPPPQFPNAEESLLNMLFCCCGGGDVEVENKDMISALAVCGRPAGDVGALKSRSKMFEPCVGVGPGGAAADVGCGCAAPVG